MTDRYTGEPTPVEVIAKWLFRRYAIKQDRGLAWELLGGKVKGQWYGDAQGILDAIAKAESL